MIQKVHQFHRQLNYSIGASTHATRRVKLAVPGETNMTSFTERKISTRVCVCVDHQGEPLQSGFKILK